MNHHMYHDKPIWNVITHLQWSYDCHYLKAQLHRKSNISEALSLSHLLVPEKTFTKPKFLGFFISSTLSTMEKVAQFYRSLTVHGNAYHILICIAYTRTFMYYTYMYRHIYASHITLQWHRLGTLQWERSSAKKRPWNPLGTCWSIKPSSTMF